MRHVVLGGALAAGLCLAAGAAEAATYEFVGSWRVDQVSFEELPHIPNDFGPIAFTGQEAAAYLFGGVASDYAISTAGDQAADIDFGNWVTHFNNLGCGPTNLIPCATVSAQDFKVSHGGYYTDRGDTSALLKDYALGEAYRNYAFRVVADAAVPEPASWALLILGFAGTGAALRRRRYPVTAAETVPY